MIILFVLIGFGFVILGLSIYLGPDKFWWWSKSNPVVPTGIVFGAFPAGLMFFLMAYIFYCQSQGGISAEIRDKLLYYVVTPLMFLALLFSMWQPRWLKPKWLRWLETHHRPIIGLLREEARKAEWRKWHQHVQTQKGLEEWVAEVRQKNKLDEADQRFIGDPHA